MARGVRVLGIDPGSRKTGFAVLESSGGKYEIIQSGVIVPDAGDIYDRILEIHAQVAALVRLHRPGDAAVEKVFFHKNPDSTIKLSYARAAVILALKQAGLPVHDYTPLDIKKAITGYGRAGKDQIRRMVSMLTGKGDFASDDESDAVAVAITRINASGIESMLKR